MRICEINFHLLSISPHQIIMMRHADANVKHKNALNVIIFDSYNVRAVMGKFPDVFISSK